MGRSNIQISSSTQSETTAPISSSSRNSSSLGSIHQRQRCQPRLLRRWLQVKATRPRTKTTRA